MAHARARVCVYAYLSAMVVGCGPAKCQCPKPPKHAARPVCHLTLPLDGREAGSQYDGHPVFSTAYSMSLHTWRLWQVPQWLPALAALLICLASLNTCSGTTECPSIDYEFFQVQLCSSFDEKNSTGAGDPLTPAGEPVPAGASPAAFIKYRRARPALCISSFTDPSFVEYPYTIQCERSCVPSKWQATSPCTQPRQCSGIGTQNLSRDILIPPMPASQGCAANFSAVAQCPGLPCAGTALVQGQLVLTRLTGSNPAAADIEGVIAAQLHMDVSKVRVYAVSPGIVDAAGRHISRLLLEEDLPGGAPSERSRAHATQWPVHMHPAHTQAARRLAAAHPDVRRVLAISDSEAVVIQFSVEVPNTKEDILFIESVLVAAADPNKGTLPSTWARLFAQPVPHVASLVLQAPVLPSGYRIAAVQMLRNLTSAVFQAGETLPAVGVQLLDITNDVLTDSSANTGVTLSVSLLRADDHSKVLAGVVAPAGGVFAFFKGRAELVNISVTVAGQFLLRVQAMDSAGGGAFRDSAPFTVRAGPMAKLAVLQQPGGAFGGMPFENALVVALTDAWGNPVAPLNDTLLQVSLLQHHQPTNITLMGTTQVLARAGSATFPDLRVLQSGAGFQLNASSSAGLPEAWVLSEPFSVRIGHTTALRLVAQPAGARGGAPMLRQPVVELIDAGGNRNVADNSSWVSVALLKPRTFPRNGQLSPRFLHDVLPNITATALPGHQHVSLSALPPAGSLRHGDMITLGGWPSSGAVLVRHVDDAARRLQLHAAWPGPAVFSAPVEVQRPGHIAPVLAGVATFRNLSIDRIGIGYTLQFTSSLAPKLTSERLQLGVNALGHGFGYALAPVSVFQNLTELGYGLSLPVSVKSMPFNVGLSKPSQLVLVQYAAGALSGSLPFVQQPKVAVADAGGNPITWDDAAQITVELLGQPAASTPRLPNLLGTLAQTVQQGTAAFTDLAIREATPGLRLRFSATVPGYGSFAVEQPLAAEAVPEQLVAPANGNTGDLFGAAAAWAGGLLAISAPGQSVPSSEVQIIKTTSAGAALKNERQLVFSYAVWRPAQFMLVLSWPASTAPAAIESFTLSWQGLTTRPMLASSPPQLVQAVGSEDLQQVGTGANALAASSVAVPSNLVLPGMTQQAMLITMRSALAPVPELTAAVPGTNAQLQALAYRAQNATAVDGEFRLYLGNLSTPWLPVHIDGPGMASAISAALHIQWVDAVRTSRDAQRMGTFSWQVEFGAYLAGYDVPELQVDTSRMTGWEAGITVQTVVDGTAPMSGTFELLFNGAGPTSALPVDATASQVQAALEALPSINAASVQRMGPAIDGGYEWHVQFQSINDWLGNKWSLRDPAGPKAGAVPAIQTQDTAGSGTLAYAWQPQDMPLTPGMLCGSGASVDVLAMQSTGAAPWLPLARGTAGANAGTVYLFTSDSRGRLQPAPQHGGTVQHRISAPLSADGALFGSAMAGTDTTLAIGAPGNVDDGVPAVFRIHCQATSGWVRISWLGDATEQLPAEATPAQIRFALSRLPKTLNVQVSAAGAWQDAPMCDAAGRNTFITLRWPAPESGEAFELADYQLSGGAASVAISTWQAYAPAALGSPGGRVGSVLLYDVHPSEHKLTLSADLKPSMQDKFTGFQGSITAIEAGHSFGTAVAVHGNMLAVGAPQDAQDGPSAGAVYIFQRANSGAPWTQTQRVLATTPVSPGGAMFEFGTAIALSGTDLAVAAVGSGSTHGNVYVYHKTKYGRWDVDELLELPEQFRSPSTSSLFGSALAMSGNVLAVASIGACGAESISAAGSGVVAMFHRASPDRVWQLHSVLEPSITAVSRRFGASLALLDSAIYVSASSNTAAAPKFPYAVWALFTACPAPSQVVATEPAARCSQNSTSLHGGNFTLGIGTARSRYTRAIPFDAPAGAVEQALREDLGIARVRVAGAPAYPDGGRLWTITFPSYAFQSQADADPALALLASGGRLGSRARLLRTSAATDSERSSVHLFTYNSHYDKYIEDVRITGAMPQRSAKFGHALAARGSSLVATAPHRLHGGSAAISGAAHSFTVHALAVGLQPWGDSVSVATEGQPAFIARVAPRPARAGATQSEAVLAVHAWDAQDWQSALHLANGVAPVTAHVQSYGEAWSATSQPIGCASIATNPQLCKWLHWRNAGDARWTSAYSWAGESDYAPVSKALTLHAGAPDATANITVAILDDDVYEPWDELVSITIQQLGVWPVPGGHWWHDVLIEDNGDGAPGSAAYQDVAAFEPAPALELQAPSSLAAAPERLGGALAMVPCSWCALDEPMVLVGSVSSVHIAQPGFVAVYQVVAGAWQMYQRLDAVPGCSAGLGASVSAAAVGSRAYLAASATADACTVVYAWSQGAWTQAGAMWPTYAGVDDLLLPAPPVAPGLATKHRYGEAGTTAIFDDGSGAPVVAVGAAGVEAVFVYRNVSAVWTQTAMLRAPGYDTRQVLDKVQPLHQAFGAAVAAEAGSLWIGAPTAGHEYIGNLTTFSELNAVAQRCKQSGVGAVYVWHWMAGMTVLARPPNVSWLGADAYTHGVAGTGGMWALEQAIEPPAHQHHQQAQFGAAVAVRWDAALIGAPGNPVLPNISWDFEQASLQGWAMQGSAFEDQPVLLAMAAYRPAYVDADWEVVGSLRGSGQYFLSTYDTSSAGIPGAVRGDAAVGMASTEIFIIAGDSISFLVGGGCNVSEVSVILMVRGQPARHATGSCAAVMSTVTWDVAALRGEAARIQVVDVATQSPWGHITVDAFTFDWPIGGYADAISAGAAYLYRRTALDSPLSCGGASEQPAGMSARVTCPTTLQLVLQASDARSAARFGASVAISPQGDAVLVGAPQALGARGANTLQVNVQLQQTGVGSHTGQRYDTREASGAVYLYVQDQEKHGGGPQRPLLEPARWTRASELTQLHSVAAGGGAELGAAVLLPSSQQAIAGMPGEPTPAGGSGLLATWSLAWSRLSFSAHNFTAPGALPHWTASLDQSSFLTAGLGMHIQNFHVLENLHPGYVTIPVYRAGPATERVHIAYATQDLSATGISTAAFDECLQLPAEQRDAYGCGLYEHTQGVLEFAPGIARRDITVRLMDDACWSSDSVRLFAVQLGLPGGMPLTGPEHRVIVRVDDNDSVKPEEFAPQCAAPAAGALSPPQ